MAECLVSILKQTPFQGRTEQWSNVYRYKGGTLDDASLDALLNSVVAFEKPVHGSEVTFVEGKVWSAGLPPRYMYISKNLTGVGTGVGPSMYKELAYLCKWPLPRRFGLNRTVQRQLLKWVHSGNGLTGDVSGVGALYSGATPALFRSYMDGVTGPVNATWLLCAPNGDVPTGPGQLHTYMEHRQFPRGRKEGP